MKVRQIMTTAVISAAPDTSVLDLAATMVQHRISAVPIVADGSLVGIVSEADLLHRYELGTERDPAARPWWRRLLDADDTVRSYVEAHAVKVRDIMTRPVVTVDEDATASEAVALFESRRIRRAPVLRGKTLVGIVSRADFVRALVARARLPHEMIPRSDESIRTSLLAELRSAPWWRADQCSVTVRDGVVRLDGLVGSIGEKAAVRVAAESIPGVRAVEDSRSLVIPLGGYT